MPGSDLFLLLTERTDCNFFRDLSQNAQLVEGFSAQHTGESQTLLLTRLADGSKLYLVAGRQIISTDRLEVLALGLDLKIQDRSLTTEELLKAVARQGAIPVLNWAPGKWFFERGKTVKTLLESFSPDSFLIGDSSLRPVGWPLPRLMRLARDRGFQIIAGSDPLPFNGEERRAGTFGIEFEGDFDPVRPFSGISSGLRSAGCTKRFFGRRSSILQAGFRIWKNQSVRKN